MIQKLLAGCALVMLLALPARAAEMRLTVDGIRSDAGEILIGLYATPGGFKDAVGRASKSGLMPDPGRLVGVSIRAKPGSQSTVFTQLPPGRYAAVVIHDANDNGCLDVNALGMPVEGYGFSNGAEGFLGAPSFAAAAVTVGKTDVSTAISLHYPTPPSAEDRSDYDRLIGSALGR